MKRAFILLCLCALAGCAGLGQNVVHRNYEIKELKSGHGIVLMSITNLHAKPFNGLNQLPPYFSVRNRRTNEEFKVEGSIGTVNDLHLVDEENWTIGRVVVLELAAGEYEIFDYGTPRMLYHWYATAKTKKPIIEFSALDGEAVYIGGIDLFLDETQGKAKFAITDELERDAKHIVLKWPKLDASSFKKKLAKFL